MNPKYIYRVDDGERFTRQKDGKYTMDSTNMVPAYRYPRSCFPKPFFGRKCDIKIVKYEQKNDGHGDVD